VCQSASIKAQLEYGVRHLDLRIAHQDGQYWGTHMWLSTPAFGPRGVFTQIKAFLREHPDEIIILIGEHLYSERAPMTPPEAVAFYRKVEDEFGSLLVECGDFSQTTFGDIWAGSGRVILIAGVETGWGSPPPGHEHKRGHSKKPPHAGPATKPASVVSSAEIADDPCLWCGHKVDSKWKSRQTASVAGHDHHFAQTQCSQGDEREGAAETSNRLE
jgi:hypothetical protein